MRRNHRSDNSTSELPCSDPVVVLTDLWQRYRQYSDGFIIPRARMDRKMRRLLITGEGYTSWQFEQLANAGFEITHLPEVGPIELFAQLPDIDAYLLGGNENLDKELLGIATKLRIISFVGTGYGVFIDEQAAAASGIVIRNTPGVMASAVVEHTIGLLLGLVRGLFSQNESAKRSRRVLEPTPELNGMTVGVVGMGAIGSRRGDSGRPCGRSARHRGVHTPRPPRLRAESRRGDAPPCLASERSEASRVRGHRYERKRFDTTCLRGRRQAVFDCRPSGVSADCEGPRRGVFSG